MSMNDSEAIRVLETALLCAVQPMQLADMRKLFGNDEEFDNTALRGLLETLQAIGPTAAWNWCSWPRAGAFRAVLKCSATWSG